MLMSRIGKERPRDGSSGRFMCSDKPKPVSFEQTFVRIGRLACEEHYRVGRIQVNLWIEQCDEPDLIARRKEFVRRKEAERHQLDRMSRRDFGRLLREALRDPIPDHRRVSLTLARHAAQHLRIRRYGGFIVSQAPNGDWRIGTKRVSAAQLVDIAIAKGFTPSLTGDE